MFQFVGCKEGYKKKRQLLKICGKDKEIGFERHVKHDGRFHEVLEHIYILVGKIRLFGRSRKG